MTHPCKAIFKVIAANPASGTVGRGRNRKLGVADLSTIPSAKPIAILRRLSTGINRCQYSLINISPNPPCTPIDSFASRPQGAGHQGKEKLAPFE